MQGGGSIHECVSDSHQCYYPTGGYPLSIGRFGHLGHLLDVSFPLEIIAIDEDEWLLNY